ncbi:uncharacterized protein LOC143838432 [Paroedura picta]|uniref:uncharacterized protein LOC143838432 n=1 Tax=Paroedura picta TaxID=143630 RepID=UPI0040579B81
MEQRNQCQKMTKGGIMGVYMLVYQLMLLPRFPVRPRLLLKKTVNTQNALTSRSHQTWSLYQRQNWQHSLSLPPLHKTHSDPNPIIDLACSLGLSGELKTYIAVQKTRKPRPSKFFMDGSYNSRSR